MIGARGRREGELRMAGARAPECIRRVTGARVPVYRCGTSGLRACRALPILCRDGADVPPARRRQYPSTRACARCVASAARRPPQRDPAAVLEYTVCECSCSRCKNQFFRMKDYPLLFLKIESGLHCFCEADAGALSAPRLYGGIFGTKLRRNNLNDHTRSHIWLVFLRWRGNRWTACRKYLPRRRFGVRSRGKHRDRSSAGTVTTMRAHFRFLKALDMK